MISGCASTKGTQKFAENSGVNKANFKNFENLHLSNIGIGTYLGDADARTDELVTNAVKQSILSGVNVVDTAINYRSQKAERSVGKAISELINDGKITRDQIFLSSKNGYVTNDADVKLGFWEYVKEEYSQKGVIKEEKFLEHLKSVFELYEQKRKEGKIKFYGMATWECFRVSSDNSQYLSLEDTVNLAKEVGGDNHGFRFIQLPYNMNYDQALLTKNQMLGDESVSALEAAVRLEIGVFTSVPFMQGRLLSPGVMPEFNDLKPSLRALQFIRSTPGVLAPLVGQKSPEHVSENLEVLNIPPMSEDEFLSLVKKLTS